MFIVPLPSHTFHFVWYLPVTPVTQAPSINKLFKGVHLV